MATIAACEHGRIFTLAVTTTPKAWVQNRRWTAGSHYVHAALGLHPELVGERHTEIDLLERLLTETTLVGEIGLDGSPQYRSSWQVQREVFIRTLSAAQRLGGRVASIHSRRAAREVLGCLAEHTTAQRVLPILHWFSDTMTLAQQAAEQGCYFSINSRMLSSRSSTVVVRELPAERVLTETDAPFTGTVDRKNGLRDVLTTIKQLAEVRGVPVNEMAAILAANAERVLAFAGIASTCT
ncbi:MAG: TatD family hydrolase [Nitrospirae bacterium]|nr:TatD family hydrolase [Candidatus Manganitrophaceae bacterium]